ncbi:MAG: ABC transporter permease subunit, partial [Bacteroidota bacterium]
YLLRNYMVGLPRDIIENAKVDGATDFEIFLKIVLPLSFPALASFAIFQFLWTWNDLLVAIAKQLDISENTSKSQLSRARKWLQNRLAELEKEIENTITNGSTKY